MLASQSLNTDRWKVSEAVYEDADGLIRRCQHPAMAEDPLQKIMFPALEAGDEEECILWEVQGMQETLCQSDAKVWRIASAEDMYLGVAIWLYDGKLYATSDTALSTATPSAGKQVGFSRTARGMGQTVREGRAAPRALRSGEWLAVSRILREERRRVLEGCHNVMRRCERQHPSTPC